VTHDDYLRAAEAADFAPETLLAYADWLQGQGDAGREEYVRQWVEYDADPGRKAAMLKVERRLKDLRKQLGDAWCDRVEGLTAVVDSFTAQCYGELLGRLDAFAAASQANAEQLDFAADLWPRRQATDEFLTAYYERLFEINPVDLVKLKDWKESFRRRLEDWLEVCLGRRRALRDGNYRRMRARNADRDGLLDELIRLAEVVARPQTVSVAKAEIIDEEKPIPRAFLFEGAEVTLALTLTVLD
jgi:uncharacterized protein (TIGR02996 family)